MCTGVVERTRQKCAWFSVVGCVVVMRLYTRRRNNNNNNNMGLCGRVWDTEYNNNIYRLFHPLPRESLWYGVGHVKLLPLLQSQCLLHPFQQVSIGWVWRVNWLESLQAGGRSVCIHYR